MHARFGTGVRLVVVVIKYALASCLLVAGLVAFAHRDDVAAAYRWRPSVERPLIPSFDPKAVAEAHQVPTPESELHVAVAPDTRDVALPSLATAATTPTVPALLGGAAQLEGVVLGPDRAPLAGATVRLERLVGANGASVDLTADGNGAFSLDRLVGGRYRIRAWRAPTYAQLSSEVTFVADGEQRSLVLNVDAPNRLDVWATAGPSTVAIGQTGTLTVNVLVDRVDPDGRVVQVGRANEAVSVVGGGVLAGQNGQSMSAANGTVSFPFRCNQAGAASLAVAAGATGVARQTVTVTCAAPAAPATTTGSR